jgi:hypothetical protein
MRSFVGMALAALCVAACSLSAARVWEKPGSTADDLSRDLRACSEEADRTLPDQLATHVFNGCMARHGWTDREVSN